MPFAELDSAAIARALSQIAERPADVADAFFERSEEIELPPPNRAPGLRVWRESGLAVRLLRDGQTWLAGRDRIAEDVFLDALRRVARAMPRAPYPRLVLGRDRWPETPQAPEVLTFPTAVGKALRAHHVSFPVRLTIRRHQRWVRTIGTQLASGIEHELFYSVQAELTWTRYGCLLADLGGDKPDEVAHQLVNLYRAREAAPPEPWRGVAVLGPAASAVLLHEAVAHSLEADTLAQRGHPEATIGRRMGSALLNVFDDPSSAPAGVRRAADDEGFPVIRRCLLRAGIVEQPLCDTFWTHRSEVLAAGAGRRGNRHLPPGPRSLHLELMPGEHSRPELLCDAEGGLYLPEAESGQLDPLTGEFVLRFPYGRRIQNQVPGALTGPCGLRGRVSDLLDKVTGVGAQRRAAGAGWCAKDGVKLPVWATCPEVRLEGVEIAP